MKKQLVEIPGLSRTIEVLYEDFQVAKSIEVSVLQPAVPISPYNLQFPKQPPKQPTKQPTKQSPKPNKQKNDMENSLQQNLIIIWDIVNNINTGEIDKIPESLVSDVIKSLMNSLSFDILKQICTPEELKNFAVYVILRGRDTYNQCFISDAIIDEYPPESNNLYEKYVDSEK
jgi:hypothetical protein